MAALMYPVGVSALAGAKDHRDQTDRLHRRGNGEVWSGHYSTINEAFAAAVSLGAPLVIAPGVHDVTVPIQLRNMSGLIVEGNGATLRAVADMDYLLDIDGMRFSRFNNLILTTDDTSTVQTMAYLYWDGVGMSTTGNILDGLIVRGRYVEGVRIGQPLTAHQCDNTRLVNLTIEGGKPYGDTTLWQRGIVIGTGTYGNCVNTWLFGAAISKHKINVEILTTIGGVWGLDAGSADIDIHLKSVQPWTFEQVRSEESKQFMQVSSPSRSTSHLSARNIQFNAERLQESGVWWQHDMPGHAQIDNISVNNPPAGITPVFAANPTFDLSINGTGWTTPATLASAFDITNKVTVMLSGYDQHAGLEAQIHGLLLRSPDGTWHTLTVADDGTLSTVAI